MRYPALAHIHSRTRSSSRTPAATTAIRSGLVTAPPAEGATAEGKGGEEGEEALDEAAAKRAALLKRYGDRTPPSGPIAVKVDPAKTKTANPSRGFDVEKAAAGEVNHNEIWGDCECAAQCKLLREAQNLVPPLMA